MSSAGPLAELGSLLGVNYLAIERALPILGSDQLATPGAHWIVLSEENTPRTVTAAADDGRTGVRTDLALEVPAAEPTSPAELSQLGEQVRRGQAEVVSSRDLLWMQAAVGVFRQRKLDLAKYRLVLVRQGDLITVIFEDRDLPPGTLGVRVSVPGYEVRLEADSRRVISSAFTR